MSAPTTKEGEAAREESVIEETYSIGGIRARVFRPAGLAAGRVGVVFLLHGRTGSARDVAGMARGLVARVHGEGERGMGDEKGGRGESEGGRGGSDGKGEARSLCVVTLDHRNHGERTVDGGANNTWSEEPPNERHALDMYAIQVGTARDVSFLIDFLPAYMFPHGEHTVAAWGVIGISLGGHSAWLILAQDARVTLGIPIIGCPDYVQLMRHRATGSGVAFAAPHVPSTLLALVRATDPGAAGKAFSGKRVLVMAGEDDALVPWSASKAFVEGLDVGAGTKEVFVEAGVGHRTTEEMVRRAEAFVGEWL